MKMKFECVMLLVMLVYVSAVNVMIIRILYRRFIQPTQLFQTVMPSSSAIVTESLLRGVEQNPTPKITTTPAPITHQCTGQHDLMVVSLHGMALTASNDMRDQSNHLHMLQKLIRAPNNSFKVDHVVLATTPLTFLPHQRTWCRSLYMHTGRTVSCSLVITDSEEPRTIITAALAKLTPTNQCVRDLMMVPLTLENPRQALLAYAKLVRHNHKALCVPEATAPYVISDLDTPCPGIGHYPSTILTPLH